MSRSAASATPQVQAPGHASGQMHSHPHPHPHPHPHDHAHPHRHGDTAAQAPAAAWPMLPSLLMAGAGVRLLGVAGLLLLLWAAVAWALGEPA